ncbi:response regulator transcription factor [Clostridium manihotivorum]|uniref:Stage 0 sporulation protein A homolog n=1 Tax=Clostridium manihotivorum TaxID=2320868 RepID=A0A410DWV1_9CLOT|nr:response regulator transcription factor [Clostridium manihotivorum]QAA33412.1 DNA-binding response regulator [Clostridium manihotivorum]
MANILIVEDDASINELIKRNLKLIGHNCEAVFDGEEALKRISKGGLDLIILDIMLPKYSGFELIKHKKDIPVIFVTAKDSLEDKLKGLTSGAEDYLVKPFEILELIARVNIVLRRNSKNEVFTFGEVKVDFKCRKVFLDNKEIEMTPQEYTLFEVLIMNRNIAMSREKLLEVGWGFDYEGDTRTVDVHIQKLRKKLRLENQIKTVYKLGYRLEA